MKNYIKGGLIFIFLALGSFAYGQDVYTQPEEKVGVEERAEELVQLYDAELAISGSQRAGFEKKLTEFLMRKDEVGEQFEGRDKLNHLLLLSQEETLEMAEILTRPQLDLYKKLKPKFQPLDTVD